MRIIKNKELKKKKIRVNKKTIIKRQNQENDRLNNEKNKILEEEVFDCLKSNIRNYKIKVNKIKKDKKSKKKKSCKL